MNSNIGLYKDKYEAQLIATTAAILFSLRNKHFGFVFHSSLAFLRHYEQACVVILSCPQNNSVGWPFQQATVLWSKSKIAPIYIIETMHPVKAILYNIVNKS